MKRYLIRNREGEFFRLFSNAWDFPGDEYIELEIKGLICPEEEGIYFFTEAGVEKFSKILKNYEKELNRVGLELYEISVENPGLEVVYQDQDQVAFNLWEVIEKHREWIPAAILEEIIRKRIVDSNDLFLLGSEQKHIWDKVKHAWRHQQGNPYEVLDEKLTYLRENFPNAATKTEKIIQEEIESYEQQRHALLNKEEK